MGRLTIHLPDDLRPLAEARASESGHASIETYVESLIRDAGAATPVEFDVPADLSPGSEQELEAALRKGLAGRFTPMTTDDWAELRKLAEGGEA